MRRLVLLVAVWMVVLAGMAPMSRAVTLEQIVSHEHPEFNVSAGRLALGNDGQVYVWHVRSPGPNGFLLRIGREGQNKAGTEIHYSANGVAVNAAGDIVVGEAHFAHTAAIYDKNFTRHAELTDFNGSGYTAPQWAEVGASNDFYAADFDGKRIVRLNSSGKIIATYPVTTHEFRVNEKNSLFYIVTGNGVDAYGFDGQKRWNAPAPVNSYTSPYDVDENGVMYAIASNSDTVQIFGLDGKQTGEIKLQMGEGKPTPTVRISDLRVSGNELFIKRNSPTEMFQRYDLKTGALKNVVSIDYEKLTATYPTDTWTAGQATPFTLDFTTGSVVAPHWRVWARPFGTPYYREFAWQDGQLQVPKDAAGLYQIKVTPETEPWQRRTISEYLVRGVVEIRAPGSKGTVNVLTPQNRFFYGRGESIPGSVMVRCDKANRPASLTLRLMSGTQVLAQSKVVTPTGDAGVNFVVPSWMTGALRPGRYLLSANAPGLTGVAQTLWIGQGLGDTPFHLTQFGDYGTDMPFDGDAWNSPDAAAFYADRMDKLGLNMLAQRALTPTAIAPDAWRDRLTKDPLATAPDKAQFPSAVEQTLAAWGAAGVQTMPILLTNDSSTALGTGFDARKPDKLTADVATLSGIFKNYPTFRGWDWAANWWGTGPVYAQKIADNKTEYDAALKVARDTGKWSPVLDAVLPYRSEDGAQDTKLFNDALKPVAPGKVTAAAAPYRNVDAYPPVLFKNVDEVDLHFQSEQMVLPFYGAQSVDFYKRPGKPAWGHPEVWNDDGTGGQILPTLFQMAMRGTDGVGFSGTPGWWGTQTGQGNDPRSAYNGTMSVFRATNALFSQYGPWLTGLHANDTVAVIASQRMFSMDNWGSAPYGTHFGRVFEAYASCLEAHYPASIVFTDDLKPDTLAKYKAVLIVGQQVELEPALAMALGNAKAGGTKIWFDGTCDSKKVPALQKFSSLGISFDKFEKDPWTWGDDQAFQRFPRYVAANLPALRKALATATKPVAVSDNPEILLSERAAGGGRFLFAVNNTTAEMDPSQMWRASLFVTARVPLVAPLRLNDVAGKAVYDVFALKKVDAPNGQVTADLRDLPARLYAILPQPIAAVGMRGPQSVQAGQGFAWSAWVRDAAGTAIDAALPVRVRLVAADGSVLEEHFATANARDGAAGNLTAPLKAPTGALTLEVTELISGKSAHLSLAWTSLAAPLQLIAANAPPAAAQSGKAVGLTTATSLQKPETLFGPHIRDIAISGDGKTAMLNCMNWNENLYGVDMATGALRWRKRAGQGFAFAPQGVSSGFAVEGMDLNDAQGYNLYLADGSGQLERRFAGPQLNHRLPQRFLSVNLMEGKPQFALPPDGSWVAGVGTLGLDVWSREGKLLWRKDAANSPAAPLVAALDKGTLLMAQGAVVTAYNAETGAVSWEVKLPGIADQLLLGRDGKAWAAHNNAGGGRMDVFNGGKLARSLPVVSDEISFAPDGTRFAAVKDTQVRFYSVEKGLQWVFNGDEILCSPRLASDGRVAVCSRLGTLYVLNAAGEVAWHKDMGSLAVPSWLEGGDLLLGTWMGGLARLDEAYKERWKVRLTSGIADMRGKMLAADSVPQVKDDSWINEAKTPLPITPNLLTESAAKLTLMLNTRPTPLPLTLTDSKPDAPDAPLIKWGDMNWLGESTSTNWIEINSTAYSYDVTGITFVEDPAHPESWLREASLEYYDESKKDWVFVQRLLSDSPVHTHTLAKPITASRWRIVLPRVFVGNLRLGEIVLHGKAHDILGAQTLWNDDGKTLTGHVALADSPAARTGGMGHSLKLTATFNGQLQSSLTNTKATWSNTRALKGWLYVPQNQPDAATVSFDVLAEDPEVGGSSQAWYHLTKPLTWSGADKGQWHAFTANKTDFTPPIPARNFVVDGMRLGYAAEEKPDNVVYLEGIRLE